MDDFENNKKEMLSKKTWAVVGVTPNKDKFGYKIWKKLKNNNYEVYAVNPKYSEVEGEKCYSSLSELPIVPEVVDLVVPPSISMKTIEEANSLNIKYLWFQPGTADEVVIDKAESLDMNIVFHDCVLVALGRDL